MGLFSGGNSNSSSTSSVSTSTTDRRGVVDNGGVLVNTGGAGSVTLTDQGAVAAALDAGRFGIEQSYKGLFEVVGLTRDVVKNSVDASVRSGQSLASAYADKAGVISPSLMAAVVIGVIALVAFKASKG